MKCTNCGGYVEWKGSLSNLTHTECDGCGGINCQEIEEPDFAQDELEWQEENPELCGESCSAWVQESQGTAFLVCDWGEEESTWFPIQPESNLAPSQWADHPADNAPAELQQKLWNLGDEAWNKWKQNAHVQTSPTDNDQ